MHAERRQVGSRLAIEIAPGGPAGREVRLRGLDCSGGYGGRLCGKWRTVVRTGPPL
jgi:hypothetical protein